MPRVPGPKVDVRAQPTPGLDAILEKIDPRHPGRGRAPIHELAEEPSRSAAHRKKSQARERVISKFLEEAHRLLVPVVDAIDMDEILVTEEPLLAFGFDPALGENATDAFGLVDGLISHAFPYLGPNPAR